MHTTNESWLVWQESLDWLSAILFTTEHGLTNGHPISALSYKTYIDKDSKPSP